ncbi:hypothetical protein K492DRAFT_241150 [Lichtheimia hyalospora FSU 10163]|nr:hypothetical protein K492DRAFT_241150 [Lichtheimia hyalospora FSU 10163]
MSARICVDYLSHEWSPNDLIYTHREIRRQVRKANSKHGDNSSPSDKYRLARFENALWRQMGRTLTDHLGKQNPMVDPAVVDWQKESDITWLYGPMYVVEHDNQNESLSLFTQKKKRRRRQGSVRFDPNVTQYSPPPIPTPSPSPLASHSLYALIDSDDEEHDHDDVVGNMFAGDQFKYCY